MWFRPNLLGLISRSAPAKVNSALDGAFSLFVGSVTMGWVGSLYDQMSNVAFRSIEAAIAFGGAD